CGDRLSLGLSQEQISWLEKIACNNVPLILVLISGSPVCGEKLYELADAVLYTGYPGQEGGNALADILFGKVSPSGRLPVTFPKTEKQLPPFTDYSMQGRTYRYMQEDPLFPFGYGLSYSKVKYSGLKLSTAVITNKKKIKAVITVKNKGGYDIKEIVQLYISADNAPFSTPQCQLKDFKTIPLKAGASKQVKFTISPEMLTQINLKGEVVLPAGSYTVHIGGSSPLPRSEQLGMSWCSKSIKLR
ncbi:MAG TPA: glycoside hydrolase family 3 C-terminal domain-containing protein, partial [Spirochaetota bacterium]|nr:glycoside hydrolase family 3 C-terminal domain-containing protein [Spirochaetota bacterium]